MLQVISRYGFFLCLLFTTIVALLQHDTDDISNEPGKSLHIVEMGFVYVVITRLISRYRFCKK